MPFLERDTLADRLIYAVLLGAFFAMPLGTGPFTVAEGALIAVWLFSAAFWVRRSDFLTAAWFWPVLLVIVLKGVGLIYTPDFEDLGLSYAKKAHYWLIPFALSGLRPSRRAGNLLLYAFLAGLFVNACVGFLQALKIVPVFAEVGKYAYIGLYGGHNTLAALVVLGMLTASYFFRESSSSLHKGLFGFLIAAYFLHLIIMESRGGYLVFAVLSPMMIYNVLPRPSIRWAVLVYALLIAVMLASPIARQRVVRTIGEIHEHFTAEQSVVWGKAYTKDLDRIYMWRWAVDLFLENPLLGVGTGGYRESMLAGGGEEGISHPHNNFLHMAVSYGVFGIAAFIWLFYVLLRAGWQHRQYAVGYFTLCSTLVLLTGGMTETHILDAGGSFLFAVTAGLQTSLQEPNAAEQVLPDMNKTCAWPC
ncbi:MAG: O-antigen ligase family protein [Desulfatiglandales bacterium]